MKLPLALSIVLLALPATAQDTGQDIRYKMDEIKKGSTITINDRRGDVITYKMMGLIGSHYYYQSFSGPDTSGARDKIFAVDIDGNLKRLNFRGGTWIAFEPHNCARVMGTCTYVEKRPNRGDRTFTRTTEMNGNTVTFSILQKDATQPFVEGTAWLDQMGWPIDANYQLSDGRTTSETMLARDYK